MDCGLRSLASDQAHGPPFTAQFLKTHAPPSRQGIEKHLGSGIIEGVRWDNTHEPNISRGEGLVNEGRSLYFYPSFVVSSAANCCNELRPSLIFQ